MACRGGIDRRRGFAGLIHIRLRQIDLLRQVLELVGDLVVVGDLCVVALVGGLLVVVEAAQDGLEEALHLVGGFRHRIQHATGLRGGLGRCRGRDPDQSEPRVGFRASAPGQLAPSSVGVTADRGHSDSDGGGGKKNSEALITRLS